MSGAGTDYTLTATMGLYKPIANMAVGLWGDLWNSNADAIDAAIHFSSGGGPFLPLAGATVFGPTTFSGTTTFTGPLNYTATGGSVARSAQARAADVANVLDFGADPTGAADSTTAFQAALATGKACYAPKGAYRITGPLVVGANQALYGDGRSSTILNVSTDFSPGASGVIALTGAELASPVVRDLQIAFAQAINATSRAGFKTLAAGGNLTTGIAYPPAIIITSSNRFRILNIAISGAWDGIINASGNHIGGYIIDNVEMGALDCGLWLDNQFDFGHVKSFHFWNFGLGGGTTYSAVFLDGNTFAAKFGVNGNCQAMFIEDFSTFEGQISIDNTNSWVHISNLGLDGGYARLTINNCQWVQVTSSYSSAGVSANPTISHVGAGTVMLNTHLGGGWINMSGSGSLYLNNVRPAAQQNTIPLIQQSAGFLSIRDSVLVVPGGLGAWTTVPVVKCTGGTTVMVDNYFTSLVGGSTQPGISISTDNAAHVVQGNFLNGWAWTPPGNLGYYALNSDGKTLKLRSLQAYRSSLLLVARRVWA